MSEQFNESSVYDRSRVVGYSRLQRDASGTTAGKPSPTAAISPQDVKGKL